MDGGGGREGREMEIEMEIKRKMLMDADTSKRIGRCYLPLP